MLCSSASIRNMTLGALLLLVNLCYAHAEIVPSVSAVLIAAGKEEATIDIKNNGEKDVLLYSKIVCLPDDDLAGGTLYTEPQAIVMAPGDTQSIRVIYRINTPDTKEHIARIIFTGLPPEEDAERSKVKIVIGQDLPVVVNVRNHIKQKDIWQRIRYRINNHNLCLFNPGAKVFRFSPTMTTEEKKIEVTFRKPYVLPGEELCATPTLPLSKGMNLQITSVSDYNYRIQTNKVPL